MASKTVDIQINGLKYTNCRFIGYIASTELIRRLFNFPELANKIVTKESCDNEKIITLLQDTVYKRLCFVTKDKKVLILPLSISVESDYISNGNNIPNFKEQIIYTTSFKEEVTLTLNNEI